MKIVWKFGEYFDVLIYNVQSGIYYNSLIKVFIINIIYNIIYFLFILYLQ